MKNREMSVAYHEERLRSYSKEEIYSGIGPLYDANELQARVQGFKPETRVDYRKFTRAQLKTLAARLQAQNYRNAAASFSLQEPQP